MLFVKAIVKLIVSLFLLFFWIGLCFACPIIGLATMIYLCVKTLEWCNSGEKHVNN